MIPQFIAILVGLFLLAKFTIGAVNRDIAKEMKNEEKARIERHR